MTEVRQYRKKPLIVEAMEWDGTVEGATRVIDWVLANDGTATYEDWAGHSWGDKVDPPRPPRIKLRTLEGTMDVHPGDFVIKGLKGEFYPHAGGFFWEAYDAV